MYQLDSERLQHVIQRGYTDSGSLNDILVQAYIDQLQKGALRKIEPSQLVEFLYSSSINDSNKTIPQYGAFVESTGKRVCSQADEDLTSTEAINLKNEQDRDYFNSQAYRFQFVLRHTVFEDGMENDATMLFDQMLHKNYFVAIYWLQEFWAEHQDDPAIFEGIVRLIGRIEDKAYWKPLMSIVRSGLTDKSKPVQESAIMVVESWRTLSCYYALKHTQFTEGWIKDYAEEVLLELEDELLDEIHKKS